MKPVPFYVLLIVMLFFSHNGTEATAQQRPDQPQPKRAKRPKFEKEAWKDVFFEDVFSEGLTGERPAKANPVTTAETEPNSNPNNPRAWSKLLPRDAVENEIKSLQQDLQKLGLSVSRFNTQFQEIQQKFSLLSMMFAIVDEYDTDVRWKKYAASAQKIFAEASTKSRAPSRAAFEFAKSKKQDLQQLVRGGAIEIDTDSDKLQWPNVIDRTTIMIRLETALGDVLKPEAANEAQFKKSKEELLQQTYMIAAMGKVVTLEGMDEADEEDYVKYAKDMGTAARQLANAIQSSDFEAAATAVNRIEQSCNDCHGDWR